ncbi:hypothetical protein MXB_4261 [Myxobolus squamalis]|nr:hypothetical protein MXB_4261 [Myxobolus squamalis]
MNNFIERYNCRLNDKFSTLHPNIEFVEIIKEKGQYFGTLSRCIKQIRFKEQTIIENLARQTSQKNFLNLLKTINNINFDNKN